MSLARLLAYCGAILFGIIFVLALFKGDDEVKKENNNAPALLAASIPAVSNSVPALQAPAPQMVGQEKSKKILEIPLDRDVNVYKASSKSSVSPSQKVSAVELTPAKKRDEKGYIDSSKPTFANINIDNKKVTSLPALNLPTESNQIEQLFNKKGSNLKFIETITYKSRVPWLKGRPAWLSDYASHFETSRHFIARSLASGKNVSQDPLNVDYFKQDILEGDRFNVFKKDIDLKFHLVVDATLCKMWLYAINETHKEKTLLKTYSVCLGRVEPAKVSGLLTPLGRYTLGNRIAIYKPKVMGYHNGKKIEMVRVFGSRWIPFEKEIADATAPAKGFGIHGVPWTDKNKNELSQDKSSIGKYESDGCVRLSTEDMEEIFSIIITKPTEIEIVKNFKEASINK